MKKFVIASSVLFALSPVAFGAGTEICGAQQSAGNAQQSLTTGQGYFIQTSFTPKCSANVYLAYEQDVLAVGVASGSKKGRSLFSGNSNGGAVKKQSECPGASQGTGCSTGDVTGATAAELVNSHSS